MRVMNSGRLTGRWAAALVVAGLIASWPACAPGAGTRPADGKLANLRFTLKDMHGKDVNLEQTFKGRALLRQLLGDLVRALQARDSDARRASGEIPGQGLHRRRRLDDDPPDNDLRKFAADFKINYPILSGLGHDAIQEAYEASVTIPVSWFIRADGTVLLKHEGIQKKEWFEKQIQQILPVTTGALEASRD